MMSAPFSVYTVAFGLWEHSQVERSFRGHLNCKAKEAAGFLDQLQPAGSGVAVVTCWELEQIGIAFLKKQEPVEKGLLPGKER